MLYYRIKLECRADREISYHIIQGVTLLKEILSGYLKSIDYLILDISSHYTYMEVTRIIE